MLCIFSIRKNEKEGREMKGRYLFLCLVLLLALSTMARGESGFESRASEQIALELTVYNSNLALIKETREIKLAVGQGELRFLDVASNIIPTTLQVTSLTFPEEFRVLEQTYQYDLLTPKRLLEEYVGKKIKIIQWHEFQDRKEVIEALLLSTTLGEIYQINGEIYLGYPGYKVLAEIPESFVEEPTIKWLYENLTENTHNLEVSYLTENLNWKADYLLLLDEEKSSADISGWVTLDNRSGLSYNNASLKLIAGTLHRVEERARSGLYTMEAAPKAASAFKEEALFEYHLYDLQRKISLKNNETKQIRLLQARGITIKKEFLLYGIQGYFARSYFEEPLKMPVNVYLTFKNSKEDNLGMPLPTGTIQLYQRNSKGSLQFVGEDSIEHTPKDKEVKLQVGEVFDILAEKIQTDYKTITSKLHESEWEITLRNHKEEDITVGILEPLLGNWQITSSSHLYKKIDAFTVRFDVAVLKGEEVKVIYRVTVGL